jgi:hypothetical protein
MKNKIRNLGKNLNFYLIRENLNKTESNIERITASERLEI